MDKSRVCGPDDDDDDDDGACARVFLAYRRRDERERDTGLIGEAHVSVYMCARRNEGNYEVYDGHLAEDNFASARARGIVMYYIDGEKTSKMKFSFGLRARDGATRGAAGSCEEPSSFILFFFFLREG